MAGNGFDRFIYWTYLLIHKKSEVARFQGIILADLRKRSPHFKTTLLASLQLIHDYDPIRFRRVQRHFEWVVNCRCAGVGCEAEYLSEIRTCQIDFVEPMPSDDKPLYRVWYAARYARTLVHEATHGFLVSRGINYTPDIRIPIEKICVREENRFARRVAKQAREHPESKDLAEVMEVLEEEFDPKGWESAWKATKWERIRWIIQE